MNHSCLVTNDTALLLPHISLLSFREVQKKWQFKSLDVLPEDLDLIPSTHTKANTWIGKAVFWTLRTPDNLVIHTPKLQAKHLEIKKTLGSSLFKWSHRNVRIIQSIRTTCKQTLQIFA